MDEHTRDIMAALAYVIAQLKQESWHYQEVVQKYDRMTDDDLMRNDYNKIIQEELAEAKAEIEKLGRICEEKDAKITELRKERDAFKQYMENTVKNSINSGSLQAEVDALKEQNGELIKQLIDYDVPLPKCAEFTGDAKQTEKSE